MSAPEQNAPPAPVSTSARTPRSRLRRRSASASSIHSRGSSAFLRSGRLSVNVRTPSRSDDSSTCSSPTIGRSDRTLGPQSNQFLWCHTEFTQYGIGVLSQAGNRTHRLLEVADYRRRPQHLDVALGGGDGAPPVPCGELRVCHHFAGHVVTGVADPGFVGRLLDIGEIVSGTPRPDGLVEDLAVRAATGVGGEPRVV